MSCRHITGKLVWSSNFLYITGRSTNWRRDLPCQGVQAGDFHVASFGKVVLAYFLKIFFKKPFLLAFS